MPVLRYLMPEAMSSHSPCDPTKNAEVPPKDPGAGLAELGRVAPLANWQKADSGNAGI